MSGEADGVEWVRPADALSSGAAASWPMMPPTLRARWSEVAGYGSVAEVLAARPQPGPVQPVVARRWTAEPAVTLANGAGADRLAQP